MKTLASFAFLIFAGCAVTDSTPATSTVQSGLTEKNYSEDWNQKLTIDDLWPTGVGITSTQVLYRSGPDRADGTHTFIAFIVWNHNTVGHAYVVNRGADGSDMHAQYENMVATRTGSAPDHNVGGNGGTSGGVTPAPHPQVVGNPIIFSTTYLNLIKSTAASIDAADANFQAYTE
jgi:hypothetical protein